MCSAITSILQKAFTFLQSKQPPSIWAGNFVSTLLANTSENFRGYFNETLVGVSSSINCKLATNTRQFSCKLSCAFRCLQLESTQDTGFWSLWNLRKVQLYGNMTPCDGIFCNVYKSALVFFIFLVLILYEQQKLSESTCGKSRIWAAQFSRSSRQKRGNLESYGRKNVHVLWTFPFKLVRTSSFRPARPARLKAT